MRRTKAPPPVHKDQAVLPGFGFDIEHEIQLLIEEIGDPVSIPPAPVLRMPEGADSAESIHLWLGDGRDSMHFQQEMIGRMIAVRDCLDRLAIESDLYEEALSADILAAIHAGISMVVASAYRVAHHFSDRRPKIRVLKQQSAAVPTVGAAMQRIRPPGVEFRGRALATLLAVRDELDCVLGKAEAREAPAPDFFVGAVLSGVPKIVRNAFRIGEIFPMERASDKAWDRETAAYSLAKQTAEDAVREAAINAPEEYYTDGYLAWFKDVYQAAFQQGAENVEALGASMQTFTSMFDHIFREEMGKQRRWPSPWPGHSQERMTRNDATTVIKRLRKRGWADVDHRWLGISGHMVRAVDPELQRSRWFFSLADTDEYTIQRARTLLKKHLR